MFTELLSNALGLSAGQTPFAWQRRLFGELLAGQLPRSLDLPTGLGKTSVMALWLLALASGANLPRRLVYVVDRRAVVDQATRVAEGLRAFVTANPQLGAGLGLEAGRELPISTLRGQFVDNKAWLEDPASAAIIVGTVDMVGSRLLFGGYGVSRKMRPYHAGLLANDALIVLDEAHLVPPFERLVSAIADGQPQFGTRGLASPVMPLKLLSLSATGRSHGTRAFELRADEVEGVVAQRLGAVKALSLREMESGEKLAEALAKEALALAQAHGAVRCIVFCNSRQDADKAAAIILAGAKKAGFGDVAVELLVGGRRVRERARLLPRRSKRWASSRARKGSGRPLLFWWRPRLAKSVSISTPTTWCPTWWPGSAWCNASAASIGAAKARRELSCSSTIRKPLRRSARR